jgi:hypothetical protein
LKNDESLFKRLKAKKDAGQEDEDNQAERKKVNK